MGQACVVEFFELSAGRSILESEIEKELTATQVAQFRKQIERLELHGRALDGDYFRKVRGATDLWEFRLSFQNIDYRLLFAEESGVVIGLCAYKEKSGAIPPNKLDVAKTRLTTWRARRAQPPKSKK